MMAKTKQVREIEFSKEMMSRFEKALLVAKGAQLEEFEFDGATFDMPYAQYLYGFYKNAFKKEK